MLDKLICVCCTTCIRLKRSRVRRGVLLFKRTTETGVILHNMQSHKRLYCAQSGCSLLVRLGSVVVSICFCTTIDVAVVNLLWIYNFWGYYYNDFGCASAIMGIHNFHEHRYQGQTLHKNSNLSNTLKCPFLI